MTREEMEAEIRNLGPPWEPMMQSFKASRDRSMDDIGEAAGQDVYEQIAHVLENHYEELLQKIIMVAHAKDRRKH